MGIKIANAIQKKARPKAKPKDPIFVRCRREALKAINNADAGDVKELGSIQHAIGRYVDGEAYENPIASYNWKLPQGQKGKITQNAQGRNVGSPDEEVEISMKAGGVRVPILDDPSDGGKNKVAIRVKARDLVASLEMIESALKNMNPETEVGRAFHKKAIKASKPKFMKGKVQPIAYDPKADQWVTFSKKKTKGENEADQRAFFARNREAREHPENSKFI